MEHAVILRTNPKGVAAISRCPDCGKEGPDSVMFTNTCDNPRSLADALVTAIEGDNE